LIVFLAGVIRFYQLDKMPVSLYWDEAAIGYNAYSIALTGKDEYGTAHPLLFRSYDDYKASGYIYLTALTIPLFGLNEFSVRFWSAFLGTITVLLAYFLSIEVITLGVSVKKQNTVQALLDKQKKYFGVLVSFLLAISPWHIQFSRVGFEANVALFLVVLGSFYLLKNVQKLGKSLVLSALSFAISFYFYRNTYVFVPVFLFVSVVIFRKNLRSQLKNRNLWISIIVFLAIFIPFFPKMISNEGLVRAKQTSVFTTTYDELMQASITRQKLGDPKWAQIIFNRRAVYAEKIITNYFSHFTPQFLFIEGDSNARHRTLGFGQMYLWEAPFLLAGIYVLWKLSKKIRYFVVFWILTAPLPASVSLPDPHALRSLNMLPMPQILVGLGIIYVFGKIQPKWRSISIGLLAIIVTMFFIRYVQAYESTVIVIADSWADGYKQLTQYIFKNENKYDKIVITGHYWQPYEYFLFYKKYDPQKFQATGSKRAFDKYVFGGTSWDQGTELDNLNLAKFAGSKNILIAFSPKEYESQKKNVIKIADIYDHRGVAVFIMAKIK
jgi:4-amino-4-deoxy-L-arabinose transferase-like glycosyltransferase